MTTWIAVGGVGLGAYVMRLVPLLVLRRMPLSRSTEELIGQAGLAAVTALIAVTTRSLSTGPAPVATLIAVAVGLVLAVRQQSMVRIVLIGGTVYAVLRFGGGLG